jgi:hypothetical protein
LPCWAGKNLGLLPLQLLNILLLRLGVEQVLIMERQVALEVY